MEHKGSYVLLALAGVGVATIAVKAVQLGQKVVANVQRKREWNDDDSYEEDDI